VLQGARNICKIEVENNITTHDYRICNLLTHLVMLMKIMIALSLLMSNGFGIIKSDNKYTDMKSVKHEDDHDHSGDDCDNH